MTLLHAAGLLLLFFLLLVLELFLPSGGLLGVAAIAALIAAIVVGFLHSLTAGGLILITTAFLLPLVVSIGLRVWPRTPLGRRMLNVDPDESSNRRQEQDALRTQWIGKVGVARMDLLPNGVIDVAGSRLDAVSLAGVIDRGANVEIVNVVAGKIQVRRTERPPDPVMRTDQPAGAASGSPSDVNESLEFPIESLGIEDLDEPFR
jgi:membrane-bound ClpP family serine protease